MTPGYLYSIDPGVTGAVCRWDPEPLGGMQVFDLTLDNLTGLIDDLNARPSTVILEQTGPRKLNGCQSNFAQGETRGIIRTICAVHDHELVDVRPQTWMHDLGLIKSDKEASRWLAKELYPGLASMLKLKKHHNRAEAILIGHWYKHLRQEKTA